MSNENGASGANGTATLKRPRGGNGNGAGVVSLGNGTVLDLGAGRIVAGALDGNGFGAVAPIPPVPPLPTVVPTKTRGPFNAAQLADLKLTEQVCWAALKPAYSPVLATCQVTGELVTALLNDVHATRTIASDAHAATNARMHATREEKTARANLFLSFRAIQSAARQVVRPHAARSLARLRRGHVGRFPRSGHAGHQQHFEAVVIRLASRHLHR